MATSFALRIPLRTGRGLNMREHHQARARRVAQERMAIGLLLNSRQRIELPCVVLLTRFSPGTKALDDDNLTGALKAVRDEVARWLKVDDADPQVRWVYSQEHGPKTAWGVGIAAQSDDKPEEEGERVEILH